MSARRTIHFARLLRRNKKTGTLLKKNILPKQLSQKPTAKVENNLVARGETQWSNISSRVRDCCVDILYKVSESAVCVNCIHVTVHVMYITNILGGGLGSKTFIW
jgi:hypothetical protein